MKDTLTVVQQFLTGAEERMGQLAVKAGQQYNLEIRFSNFKQISPTSPYVRSSVFLMTIDGRNVLRFTYFSF